MILLKWYRNTFSSKIFPNITVILPYRVRNYSVTKSAKVDIKKVSPFGWFLLVIPISTFSLGVWQVKRKIWKEKLIAEMLEKTTSDPIELPANIDELGDLQYKPIHVRGTFLHDKELYMGPRSLLQRGDSSTKSSLISGSGNSNQGYLVITPFKLENRDETILVNRGWVPTKFKNPKSRQEAQVDGVVDVIGILRSHENRPNFTMKNKEGSNIYFYRDLQHMAAVTDSSQIFLDATNDFDIPKGPIGGQTRINLRNEHLSYIITWFSLSGATSYMWFKKFIK